MTLVYCRCQFCDHLDNKEGTCDLAVILIEPGGCLNYKYVRYIPAAPNDKGGETSEQQPE